ncbi:MAG: hypothetical protein EOP49_45550, partial [Sphingobacteriales bacterium]
MVQRRTLWGRAAARVHSVRVGVDVRQSPVVDAHLHQQRRHVLACQQQGVQLPGRGQANAQDEDGHGKAESRAKREQHVAPVHGSGGKGEVALVPASQDEARGCGSREHEGGVEFNHLLSQPLIKTEIVFSASRELVNFSIDKGISGQHLLIILAGLVIGAISFAGSMIAWGKLNGKVKDFAFKGQHITNLVVFAIILAGSIYLVYNIHDSYEAGPVFGNDIRLQVATWPYILFYTIVALSLIYGILFVLPIGGADMPVVISLLNSFTGVAAACGGFLYNNKVMLTGGILVGAAGTLLTILMCKAMNRSLINVLVGSFGGGAKGPQGSVKDQGNYKEISLTDAAVVMSYASKVMIVPGYGLAVAQAQHACHELEKMLSEKGVDVKYAI